MKKLKSFLLTALSIPLASCSNSSQTDDLLDYDNLIHLDSEFLAEEGILESYMEIKPKLKELGIQPADVKSIVDHEIGIYAVTYKNRHFDIFGPNLEESEINNSWGRATYSFFEIINDQLNETDFRFYAINGGNDLGGIFLKQDEVDGAKTKIMTKTDWPYIPTSQAPWYGQFHD